MSEINSTGSFPQSFGKYILLNRIAVGGMAEIFRAKTTSLGGFEKILAIKRLHSRFTEDQEFIHMLIDEARISVQLSHMNIGQIFDLDKIGEHYFICMEYIDGPDIFRILKRCKESGYLIPIEASVFIAMELCHGMDYAHRKKGENGAPLSIVHRDISPPNIIISYEGEVKIVDFGIAKATQRSYHTDVGIIKGKFYYMSPEQARGGPIDHRTDIFSAGVVLYEMLTGRLMYRDDDDAGLLARVRRAEFDPPRAIRGDIPRELEQIVLRALQRSPSRRFGTALEMGSAMQAFLFSLGSQYNKARLGRFLRQLFGEEEEIESDAYNSAEHSMFGDKYWPSRSSLLRAQVAMPEGDVSEAVSPLHSQASAPPADRMAWVGSTSTGSDPVILPLTEVPRSPREPRMASSPLAGVVLPPTESGLVREQEGPQLAPEEVVREPEPAEDVEDDDETTVYLGDRPGHRPSFPSEDLDACPSRGPEGWMSAGFDEAGPAVLVEQRPVAPMARRAYEIPRARGMAPNIPSQAIVVSRGSPPPVSASLSAPAAALRPGRGPTQRQMATFLAILCGLLTTGWLLSFCGHSVFLPSSAPRPLDRLGDAMESWRRGMASRVTPRKASAPSAEVPRPAELPGAELGPGLPSPGRRQEWDLSDLDAPISPRWLVLDLSSRPAGARVELNESPIPETTPLHIKLPIGLSHRVRLTLEHHHPWERIIHATSRHDLEIVAELVPILGWLELRSTPQGAEVFLESLPVGVTPLELSDLFIGVRPEIMLRLEGYQDQKVDVDWKQQRHIVLDLELTPRRAVRPRRAAARRRQRVRRTPRRSASPARPIRDPSPAPPRRLVPETAFGYLTVRAIPFGRVLLDGRDLGIETPMIRRQVRAGPHQVKVHFPSIGSFSEQRSITISGEQETTLLFRAR